MTNGAYPVLCGGTFFTLLLEARKARSGKREQLYGDRDGLSEPEMLAGFVRVMYPEFKAPSSDRTFKTNTSEYKLCKSSGGNLPFFDQEIKAFDRRVRSGYETPLAQMVDFTNRFIEAGGSVIRDEWLVKELLELIDRDRSINDNDGFYVCENGQAMTKAALRSVTEVCLPAFLLGVWHFAVARRQDNTIGRSTIDVWCPLNNRRPRVYAGQMGEGILREIRVNVSLDESAEKASYEPYPTDEELGENNMQSAFGEQVVEASESSKSQGGSNTYTFNQNGNNNVQIGSIDTLTINNG